MPVVMRGLWITVLLLQTACWKEPNQDVPPDYTFQIHTVRFAFDYNRRETVDVREGNLWDLAVTIMRTRNGVLSAELYRDSNIMEIKYRDDRISEEGLIRELASYFRMQNLNVNITRVETLRD